MHEVPAWLIDEPISDVDLGVLTTGKEAQINLRERTAADGRACLIARKRYLPREVTQKGELEALGFQGTSTFRRDDRYRGGRDLRIGDRERRAMDRKSAFGKQLLRGQWTEHEYTVLADLWHAGLRVPYPVAHNGDTLDLEYIGARDGAAPQLQASRLSGEALRSAYDAVVDGLHLMTRGGWVHGDLSAYNLLWWDSAVWFIDFPQAVSIRANLDALDLLHRDVTNVFTWFDRRGLNVDPENVFADLLTEL